MEIKDRLHKALTRRIEKEEEVLALCKKKMNGNYLHFFENYAEVMYKTVILIDEYKAFLASLEELDLNTFNEIMERTLARYTRDLLTRSLSGCSTSQMYNMAFVAGLEAKQTIISTIQSLIEIAKDKDIY